MLDGKKVNLTILILGHILVGKAHAVEAVGEEGLGGGVGVGDIDAETDFMVGIEYFFGEVVAVE